MGSPSDSSNSTAQEESRNTAAGDPPGLKACTLSAEEAAAACSLQVKALPPGSLHYLCPHLPTSPSPVLLVQHRCLPAGPQEIQIESERVPRKSLFAPEEIRPEGAPPRDIWHYPEPCAWDPRGPEEGQGTS